jgi:N,N'-diacetylchitobiose transport system permease protein
VTAPTATAGVGAGPVPVTAAPARVAVARRRGRTGRVLTTLTGLLVLFVFAFPVYWMVNTSFLRGTDLRGADPTFLPLNGTLDNYRRVFDRDFLPALRMSLIVTVSTVVAALLLALLAAVAVSRFRFRGRTSFIVTVLVIQMVPPEAMVISLFKVLDGWQLVNTAIGLVLVYLIFVLPFTIWTLRGFVAGVPLELEEAAMVDGCGRLRAFLTITFPLMAPGLVATGVYAFIQAWNEFIFALVLMNRGGNQTLPVWLQTFNEGAKGTDWGGVMAGSTLMAIPVIIFFLLVQGRMTQGLVAGAVKG